MNVLDELEEIKELVNNDKKFKYKNIVNFNCDNIKEELNYASKCHNLEEQIGCPLEVVAHLVMNKPFYYEDGYGKMHFIQGYELCTCSLLFGNTWEDFDIYVGENGDIEIPLSDYKKSFWLKKDKSE